MPVCIARFLTSAFSAFFFFFFFFRVNSNLTWVHCSRTVWHCSCTVYVLKNIKNETTILFTHLKIILLQCFQFSVFSFKFSATISSIQTDPYRYRLLVNGCYYYNHYPFTHIDVHSEFCIHNIQNFKCNILNFYFCPMVCTKNVY